MNADINENCKHELVVGVVGGMGPEATADFYLKLLAVTPAAKDQDHLRVIIDSNGKVPDRVASILGSGESSAPVLQDMAKGLQQAGAELLVIPCNTAHYYYDDVQAAVSIPVMHMQQEVMAYISKEAELNPENAMTRIGLLATAATVKTGLYQRFAAQAGIDIIDVEDEVQETLVTEGIRAVKAGDKEKGHDLLRQAALTLINRGALGIIAGCTEIPLVLTDGDLPVPVIDSTAILALATLRAAKG